MPWLVGVGGWRRSGGIRGCVACVAWQARGWCRGRQRNVAVWLRREVVLPRLGCRAGGVGHGQTFGPVATPLPLRLAGVAENETARPGVWEDSRSLIGLVRLPATA